MDKQKTTFAMEKITVMGSAGFLLIVRRPDDELRAKLVATGYALAVGVADRWEIQVSTAEQLTAARAPIMPLHAAGRIIAEPARR